MFTGAIVDQGYDIFMIFTLMVHGEHTFAFLFVLIDFTPGMFTMWLRYLSDKKWNWRIFILCCHPINMIIWPIKTALKTNQHNMDQLEVFHLNKCLILYFLFAENQIENLNLFNVMIVKLNGFFCVKEYANVFLPFEVYFKL